MKKISILCTDPLHPVNPWLERWAALTTDADVRILRDVSQLQDGDFLFLVSCQQIVRKAARDAYGYSLVLHASALPQGRGMSPHVWQILEGSEELTVSLIDADDVVDTGKIWHQVSFRVERTALADEINHALFDAEVALMNWALANCDKMRPRSQEGASTTYSRRSPADSQIDVNRPLADFFDLLRIADPDRFPAFFFYRGQKYRIRIDKL